MMDGAESRVPCGGDSVVGVGGISPSRHDGEPARRPCTAVGEKPLDTRSFELVGTVSSASGSELATVEN